MYAQKSMLVAGLALAFAVAAPVFAEETTTTTETETTAVTTTSVTAPTPKVKPTIEELAAMWKAKFAVKKSSTTATMTANRKFGTSLKTVDASCMQGIVDTREVALQSAWSQFNTSVSGALTARQTALYSAWGNAEVDDRAAAIKDAWSAWKNAHKEAFRTLKTERSAAWKTFRDTAKTSCNVTLPKEEKLVSDAAGSVSL
jgi:hypothetical protein